MEELPSTTAVDLEQTRLESLIILIFENRHYMHSCDCETCQETRKFLAPRDLQFVDHVSSILKSK